MTQEEITGFILSRQWHDRQSGIELELWLSTDQGPIKVILDRQEAICFIAERNLQSAQDLLADRISYRSKALQLRDFLGDSTHALYFPRNRDFYRARDRLEQAGIELYEADIRPVNRFLMERFVQGSARLQGVVQRPDSHLKQGLKQKILNPVVTESDYVPSLKTVSVDIETALHHIELFSIGVYAEQSGETFEKVWMVAAKGSSADMPGQVVPSQVVPGQVVPDYVELLPDEQAVLLAFIDWLQDYDPDVLIGWNVINFDLRFLQRIAEKYRLDLALGREREPVTWRQLDDEGDRYFLLVPGRVALDGIELLRNAFYQFESFSLENVSREVLGEGKLLHDQQRGEQIGELFETDKAQLAEYNLKDCELVWRIFEKTALLDFAVARSQITGLAIDRMGGSVASFDNLYLPRLHRRGFVAPNASQSLIASPGGYVMNSQPGIYDYVLVLDFKSLYPSIIRTFAIDPMGLAVAQMGETEDVVPGFLNAEFSRDKPVLPDIIAELWQRRDQAKAADDSAMSQAIKIIMNSFYGVLGTPACRFFDARLASSITRRGHDILQRTRDYIEGKGYPVIYGDTDSVFVWAKQANEEGEAQKIGVDLARDLNQWWRDELQQQYAIDSVLEIEFETLFTKFLMPTIRGSEKGSKKRYAGVVNDSRGGRLVFKGLENVRTDWTLAAREFQQELYRRVFFDEPYCDYVIQTARAVTEGKLDNKLVYRKRLRRKLDDYQRNIPPHVQAARVGRSRGNGDYKRGAWVEYVITLQGAEPAASQQAQLDYQHYLDTQLAPVADGILHFLDTSFAEITGQQIALF